MGLTADILRAPEWDAKAPYEKAQARRDLFALVLEENPPFREAFAAADLAERQALADQFKARLDREFPDAFQKGAFIHAKANGRIHTVTDRAPVRDIVTEQLVELAAPRAVRGDAPAAAELWADAQERFRTWTEPQRRALAPFIYERYDSTDMTDAAGRPLFGTLDEMIEARPSRARQAAAFAIPAALRIAPPVAASPTGNPLAVMGAGAAGEALAQIVEQKLGVREKFSPTELGINTAFSAIPGMTLGRTANRMLDLTVRTGVRAAEGAAQGVGGEALRQLIEDGQLDGDKLVATGVFGAGLGGLIGAFEPRVAALLAGKTQTDALATLREALAQTSPEDRSALESALRQVAAAITPSADGTAPARHSAADTEPAAVSFATERDKALTGGWRAIAAHDGAFQWPHSDAKTFEDVARDMSLPGYGVTVSRNALGNVYLDSERKGFIGVIHEPETGLYHINSMDGRGDIEGPNTGGAQLYQVALSWAHNNGHTIGPDRTLSAINELRRTSAMLSSGLRFGTTDHMLPHVDQRVPWIRGDHEANIAALARREAELVAERLPQTKGWSTDSADGTFRDQHGQRLTADDVAAELRKNGGHDTHGVGTATLRRALLTRKMDAEAGGLARMLRQDARLGEVYGRSVLYGERASGGTGPENLGGDGASAPVSRFSEAELDRELATIRKAFPALLRRYDLQAGEVEKLLRTRGYEGEVPAHAVAALARLRGHKALIVLGARAFRDRASGAALLTHEVGHAYWDTLDDATRQTLRDLRTRELEAKTGPLFRDGQLNSLLAHVDEASERGVQEWFAERIARLNEAWAHGRLDRADLPLLRRLSYDLREKIREIAAAFARRERLDPDSELFERRFREFFAGGAKSETAMAFAAKRANPQTRVAPAVLDKYVTPIVVDPLPWDATNRENRLKMLAQVSPQKVPNADTGQMLLVDRSSYDHSFGSANGPSAHAVLAELPNLARTAVRIGGSYDNVRTGVREVHRYLAAVARPDGVVPVRLTVFERNDGTHHVYDAQPLGHKKTLPTQGPGEKDPGAPAGRQRSVKVGDLLPGVKETDSGEFTAEFATARD